MATLELVNLHCNETEDNSGSDECELRVWCDMNNTEDWSLGLSLPFNRRVKIQLWDLDAGYWWDKHDLLGTATMPATPVEDAQATFTQDGADFVLPVLCGLGKSCLISSTYPEQFELR